MPRLTGHQYVKELIATGEAQANGSSGRQLIDLVQQFPIALPPINCAGHAYSGAARLLDRVVAARRRRGSASADFGGALREATAAPARASLRTTSPSGSSAATESASSSSPTGISRCRRRTRTSSWSARNRRRAVPRLRAGAPRHGAKGRNWLFFGDRQFTHDFLYQLEWQDALNDGSLTRMDVAFSRDQPEKVYVQHRLWERRARSDRMARDGAYFYVCGDAKAMAKDVRATLVRAYADVKALAPDAGGAGGGAARTRQALLARHLLSPP